MAARPRLRRRVEAREVLADDLFRPVTRNLLGARVPAQHDAPRVQREDRVITDALDHRAEEGFAREGLPALRPAHFFRHPFAEFVIKHLPRRLDLSAQAERRTSATFD